jgi:hypothetical protein
MTELSDKDIQLEARLIEQEHRLFPVVANLVRAKSYDNKDPRRIASIKALLHKILFGGTAALAFGGVIAWATLYYTSIQTDALLHQNELMTRELELNRKNIEEQRWIENLGRRTELLKVLYAPNVPGQSITVSSSRLKSEALVEYVELQDLIARKSKERFFTSGSVPRDAAMYKFGINLTSVNMQGISISQIDFSRSVLHRANFQKAKLFSSSFVGVPLDWADFSNADLRFVDFSGASLLGANLTNAFLGGLKWDEDTKVFMANIHGVKEPPEGFVEWALKSGSVDEPNLDKWVSERNKLKRRP